jgi:hypothetical protein
MVCTIYYTVPGRKDVGRRMVDGGWFMEEVYGGWRMVYGDDRLGWAAAPDTLDAGARVVTY